MKIKPDAWKSLPVAGALLLLAALAVCSAVYLTNVQARERYLQSRNFRLLASLASQADNLIRTSVRVEAGKTTEGAGRTQAEGATAVVREAGAGGVAGTLAQRPFDIRVDGGDVWVRWAWSGDGNREAVRRRLAPSDFESLLEQKRAQRAFDTLALAAPSGEVVLAVGRRRSELQVMSLDTLVPAGAGAPATASAWVPSVIAEHRVTLAGADYRLFVQPCCRYSGGPGAPSVGLVLVGLVEANALRSEAMAISPLLVLAAVVLVLAALVSWAFLKVALVSARQRISPLDALQLGASSVFGLAMATVLVLSVAAYARLRADVDGQLEQLGEQIESSLSAELAAAYAQSRKAMPRLLASGCAEAAGGHGPSSEACRDQMTRIGKEFSRPGTNYPDFTFLFLVDGDGMQQVKVGRTDTAAHLVNVADRDYFKDVRRGRLLRFAACEGPEELKERERGCAIESVWSWTTGAAQVVLAHPTSSDRLPVAAIATSMRSVMHTVLPVGYEFAIVDAAGHVRFHADVERQGHENLLVETDQNPRLRALMSAQSAGNVSTPYWGRPHRVHVRPAPVPGWSIVTLFDKQHARALVLEWTAASLFLLSGYMAVWIVAMLMALCCGASWMWPDPFRRRRYRTLSMMYAGFVAVLGAVAWRGGPTAALYAVLVLAPLAWVLTAVVLAGRPSGVPAAECWALLDRDYRVMGALALVLTAVAPGAAFVAFSYDLHMESYVKHRQLALVQAASSRPRWQADTGPHVLRNLGDYTRAFYDSSPPPEALASAPPPPPHTHRSLAHSLLEDYLPYYTSFSVEMRELLHEHAEDDTWTSSRAVPGRLEVSVRALPPGARLRMMSVLPSMTGIRALAGDGRVVYWTVATLALLAVLLVLAWWVVGYLLRHVFLSDVIDRVWLKGLVPAMDRPILIVCDDPAAMARQFEHVHVLRMAPLASAPDPDAAWWQARKAIEQAGPARAIVVPDLDEGVERRAHLRRMLGLIESLVADPLQAVVVVSSHMPRVILESAASGQKGKSDRARWSGLFDRFAVLEVPAPAGQASKGWREALLEAEGRPTRALQDISTNLEKSWALAGETFTEEQILDQFEERARPLYRRDWQACTPDERIVLEHVARHGLANAASRPVVRNLLVKGLLRKDPELRLMNRTFTRFVLEGDRRREVTTLEGLQAEASLWDRLRLPLGLGATAAIVFLVTTQREMFDATVTVAAGVTTAVPTLLRLTTLLAQLGGKGSGEAKAA